MPFVPGFQGRSGIRITISSEKVMSGLLLQVQEDRPDKAWLIEIRAVIRQAGDGGAHLLDRCRQP